MTRRRSGELKRIQKISHELLTNTDKVLPSPAQAFFEIMDILEAIPDFENHLNLISILTNLFQQKLSVLADEKTIAFDSSGQTILHRLIKKNYPLLPLNTLLSQPEAKYIVLHHEAKDSLITDLQQYVSLYPLDPQQDPLLYYLALTEQPWQSLMKKCNNYLTSRYRPERCSYPPSPDLLKILLTRFGDFPWNAAPAGLLNPALFGYHLLIFFLCQFPAPLTDIEDLIKHKTCDFFEKIRKDWLELFPPARIFEKMFTNFLLKGHREDVFARIDFVLSRKIDSEAEENEFINLIAEKYYDLTTSHLIKTIRNILPHAPANKTLLYQLARFNFKTHGEFKDIFREIATGREPFAKSLKRVLENIYIQLESYCQNPSFFSLVKKEEKENFIFLLISFQARIDHLQQLCLSCTPEEKAHIEQTIKRIIPSLINIENSTYLTEIFSLFSPSYSNEMMESLNKKHAGVLNPESKFADNISAAITAILSQNQSPPFKELIAKPEVYHDSQSQAQTYLQKVKRLFYDQIVEVPASLLVIITDYLRPENLITIFLKNPSAENFHPLKAYNHWNKTPIITYMAFTGSLIIPTNAEHQLIEATYEEIKEKTPERERENIINNMVVSIEASKKQSLANLFQAITDFNETDPTTILTIARGTEQKAVIADDTFPAFQLKFLANLVNLTQRYAQGKTIAYPFVIHLSLTKFAVVILLCAKGIGQNFLATENITTAFPSIKEYIQKLLEDDISDLENEFLLFTKANPLSSFYKEEKLEITPRLEALIDCWEALSKHERLRHLVDLSGFNKIKDEIVRPDLKLRMQKIVYNLTGSISDESHSVLSPSPKFSARKAFFTTSPHSTLFSSSPSYPAIRIDRRMSCKLGNLP